MLFLSHSPYLKLLFYIVSTIIKAFIITGHQFLYPLLAERGRLSPETAGCSAERNARYHDFVELSNPFPHHSITHGIFTVYFTYLTMNISRFHISCIQQTNNRPYFTVGGALDHLQHFKRTEQYVNTICFSLYWRLWLLDERRKTERMREITTSALRRKYWQTVLNFRIRFVVNLRVA